MPYIPQGDRPLLEPESARPPETKGELNYQVTVLARRYIRYHGLSYDNVSDAIAALNDAAAELRRRVLDPYEDGKIETNGDVY